MSGYPLFFPEFVLCTNSSLFWFKIANELSEFRNYLIIISHFYTILHPKGMFINRTVKIFFYVDTKANDVT